MKRLVFIVCLILLSLRSAGAPVDGQPDSIRYGISDGLSSTLIGGGVQDSKGLIWVATWHGLNCYDGYDFHPLKIIPGDESTIGTNRIRDILMMDDGNILCHTDDDIFVFDLRTYTFYDLPKVKKDSLSRLVGRVWKGFTDKQGNFWNADKAGLYKKVVKQVPAKIIPHTENKYPRAFMVDRDGNIFIGTRNPSAVLVYSADLELKNQIETSRVPYCIYQTGDGNIWVGCKPGELLRLDIGPISDDVVYDMAQDNQGRLWIATFGDGIKFVEQPSSNKPKISKSLGGKKIRKIIITPSQNIVAATTDGLLIGKINNDDISKTKFTTIKRDGRRPGSLSSDATMSVVRSSQGMIFVSTESSGIDMIDEESLFSDNPEFRHFNISCSSLTSDIGQAMSLASDSVLAIVGVDNVIFFNPFNNHSLNFSKSFWGDNCIFTETQPLRLADGCWIFGADKGALLATSHNLYSHGYIPPIVFTTIAINGNSEKFCLPPCDEINLSAKERNITIHFAAIDYTDNKDILYRSRLDDSPWTSLSSLRSVTLFNISPGSHKLYVQSTDRYGRIVDNTKILQINVARFWYETWWARLTFAAIILIVIGLILLVWLYIRQINRQRRDLLKKYMAIIGEQDRHDSNPSFKSNQNSEPVETINDNLNDENKVFLERVRKYIEENIDNPDADVDAMASAVATSRSTLNRRLRSLIGISASKLMTDARMQKAATLLDDKNHFLSLDELSRLCGYSDKYYFSRVFKNKFGCLPTEYGEK